MSIVSRIKNRISAQKMPIVTYEYSVPIDWKELAPTALWALQEQYEIDVLSASTMENLAAMYSNVPIDEGAAALGQELSYHGYALYDVQTGNDESVFLLLQSETEPEHTLYGIWYKNMHYEDEDEEPEAAYEVNANLLLQTGKNWGQKAKRIRSPKINIRLPSSALPSWELSDYEPKEEFFCLNGRFGLLSQEFSREGYARNEYTNSMLHVINLNAWDDVKEGVSHMFVTTFSHEESTTPIDWAQFTKHPFAPYQKNLLTKNETVYAYTIPFVGLNGADAALRYDKDWLAVGSAYNPSGPFDPEIGDRTHTPPLHSQHEIWLDFIGHDAAQTVLSLPQVYPPPAMQYPADAAVKTLPHSVVADYWVDQVFTGHDSSYWLDGHVNVCMTTILGLEYTEPARKAAYDTFNFEDSRFKLLLHYSAAGALKGWLPYQLPKKRWSHESVWGFAPSTIGGGQDAYLLRNIVDDSKKRQCYYTQVLYFDDAPNRPQLKLISSHDAQITGGVCYVSECAGLPASEKGFFLYGGEERAWNDEQQSFNDQGFSLNIVHLDTGKAWQRSLKGMQPKFDKCRYDQRIHPKPLPNGWVLLDIIGGSFGLTECAWLWHMESDRFFALALSAVTDDRENADFHYHPDMDCLFAHSTSFDRPEIVERLVPLPEMLASIENTPSLARIVPPWTALASTL